MNGISNWFINFPAYVKINWTTTVGVGGSSPSGPENGVIDDQGNQIVDSDGNNIIHA